VLKDLLQRSKADFPNSWANP